MSAVLATPPFLHFVDNDGLPLAGWELHTFAAGTLNRKATYTDVTALVEKTNPIILDSAGRTVFWINGSYKYILTPPGVGISDPSAIVVDNVTNFNTLADAVSPLFKTFEGDGTTTVFDLEQDAGTASENLLIFIDDVRPEHVINGDFVTDTDWTKGTGWVIGTGVATATTADTALSQTSGIIDIIEGVSYTITYTITRSAGSIIPSIGGVNGTSRDSAGTYTETIIAGATQAIAFTGTGFTGTVDNVSVKTVYDKGFDIQDPSLYSVNGAVLTFANPPLDGALVNVFAPSLLLGAASAAASAAEAASATASGFATEAEEWATKIDGIVEATDYSSKAYAIGGTGVTDGEGASKEWAIKTTGTVDGSEYSAKAYAQEDLTGATGGSAKDWAVTAEDTEVTSGLYSSLHYAAKSADSAVDSANQATKLTGTSTTSVEIGTGSKVFTTQADKDFNGNNVRVFSDADPTNYMDGLASYTGTTLTIAVTAIGGSGTFTDWTIRVNGARGATGEAGSVTDGDKGDITVSSDGTVWTANSTLVTGKTEADPELDDQFVISDTSDTGALKRTTLQKIYDKVIATLFGGSTVTPTGTELVALDDGTNVTAQSIADLASGGGLTFSYQDFQATTDTTLEAGYATIKLTDGKILQARHIAGTPWTIGLRILTVATDGTITLGAETVLSGANSLGVRGDLFTPFIALSEDKVIIQYLESTANNWKIALLTTDTTANTVTVENTYTVATGTTSGYSSLRTQSARLSSTTAMLISGTNSTAGSSNTVGRIVTLATPTTLTIGSTQNIETNTGRRGQYCRALVQEPFSGDWVIMGYNNNLGEFCGISFTVSGSTITGKTFARTHSTFGNQNQIQGMFAIPKKDAGFIFGMVNNGTAIEEGTGNVEMGVNRLNIFSPQYSKDATYWSGGVETSNLIVRIEDCIANNIPSRWNNSLQTQLTDDYYIVYNKPGFASPYVLVINRTTGETNRIKLVTKNDLLTTSQESLASITQVRDNQYLITTLYSSLNYINYQPFTIG